MPVLQHCCAAFCFHRCMVCVMLIQSAACLICAVASGYMLRRWWRLDDYDRARIWKHYGLFCGLMCFGSCAGAVSYAAISFYFDGYYKSFTGGAYNYSFYSRVSFALRCSQLHSMARSQFTRNSFSVFAMVRCVFAGLSVYVLLPCHRKALGTWPFDRFLQAESARLLALEHAWPCSCWHHCSWQRGWAMLQHSRIRFHAKGCRFL